MPYCSSDGKLAGFDEIEAELNSSDWNGDELTAEVRLVRPCASCGDEASTYDSDLSGSIEHVCPKALDEDGNEQEPDFDIDFDDPEVEDYYQTTSRTGRVIRNPRYQKHLFAVVVSYSGTCNLCGEPVSGSLEDRDIAASYFDTETSH